MTQLNHIFSQPTDVKDIDQTTSISIYPIKLKDLDEFHSCSYLLNLSKDNFQESDKPLLFLIFIAAQQLNLQYEQLVEKFCKLFSLVTQREVSFDYSYFCIGEVKFVGVENYPFIREIIMKQNLIHEPKVFKDPAVQEWADIVMQSKSKNAPKITIEDMITTVSVETGKHYAELANYSKYQLYSDFYRIRKIKNYDLSLMARSNGADVPIEDFAEDLDMHKNPYDDLFVDSKKLDKFN